MRLEIVERGRLELVLVCLEFESMSKWIDSDKFETQVIVPVVR